MQNRTWTKMIELLYFAYTTEEVLPVINNDFSISRVAIHGHIFSLCLTNRRGPGVYAECGMEYDTYSLTWSACSVLAAGLKHIQCHATIFAVYYTWMNGSPDVYLHLVTICNVLGSGWYIYSLNTFSYNIMETQRQCSDAREESRAHTCTV